MCVFTGGLIVSAIRTSSAQSMALSELRCGSLSTFDRLAFVLHDPLDRLERTLAFKTSSYVFL